MCMYVDVYAYVCIKCIWCMYMDVLVPPLLWYGKYCGIGYTGCPGEKPCDGLDACCKDHDACIGSDPSKYNAKLTRFIMSL